MFSLLFEICVELLEDKDFEGDLGSSMMLSLLSKGCVGFLFPSMGNKR
jgi:hypothetical protein